MKSLIAYVSTGLRPPKVKKKDKWGGGTGQQQFKNHLLNFGKDPLFILKSMGNVG